MITWQRVSKEKPCSVCRKPDWCTVSADGAVACCMRIESDLRMGNGGWRHRLDKNLFSDPVMRSASTTPPAKVYLKGSSIGSTWVRFTAQTNDEAITRLSTLLEVTSDSLRSVGACWAWPYDAWGFPMFDGAEQFAGLRLRSDDGDKWALRGGRQGIFIPSADVPEHVVVCEGPTDTAAALSVGIYAIGRPSCTGGVAEIKQFARRHKVRSITVCADSDGPGQAGGDRFCREIGLPARLARLPYKDLREWIARGATREVIECCFKSAKWR